MSATIIKASKEEVNFLIQIDSTIFEKALMDEYHQATSADDKKPAPAFLSNHALLGQYPELDKIAGKALDKLMPSYYMKAIKELEIHPITFPKIMPRATELGQPCVVEVQVIIEPEIELKQFEGLEATYTAIRVTDGDIDQQLTGLRKQHGAENDDAKLLQNIPFDSVEALKEDIRKAFTDMAEEKTNHNKKEAVLKRLVEANPFPLKREIIEQQIMIEINQIRQRLGAQVMDNYMKSSGRTIETLKKEVRPQAEATVKKNLLLSAIAEKIQPEITEEDIKDAIAKQTGSFMDLSGDYETRRKKIDEMPGALDQIKHAIRIEKVTLYIVSKAILHETKSTNIMDELPEYMK